MKKASDLLSAFFDRSMAETAGKYAALFGAWERISDSRASAHSRIVELEKGVLFVAVDHPGWIQVIQMNKERYLENARSMFPNLGISGIALFLEKDRPAILRKNNEPAPAETQDSPAAEMEHATYEELYGKLQDPALRESFKRMEANVLRKTKPR